MRLRSRISECLIVIAVLAGPFTARAWRSSLYPDSWTPADKDAQGRFLHDFSYAGYHKGEIAIPTNPPGLIYDVTGGPYNADNTGSSDATTAIQAAIDDAGAAGGGIVYLPAGTYNVAPGGNSYALRIRDSGVVLRGAGTNQTYICNTDTYMRSKNVILVQPSSGDWHTALGGTTINAASDIDYPTRVIPLTTVTGLSVGDTIVVRADCTEDFIADHGMTGLWTNTLKGPTFLRKITSINVTSNTVNIDIPTRYYLKTRDSARIYKVGDQVEEVGIEDLSIGMVENTTAGWGDNDYSVNGTGAYEVHGSHAIKFVYARNCWVQRFQTYRPTGNPGDYHILSNILLLSESAHVTVRYCMVQKPKYEGGGGNGYGYTLRGGDCLITECTAHHTRHNYDFKSMWTSGNVIHKSTGSSPRLSSDFHMHLSIGNMFDSMTVTGGDWLQAKYRPYGTAPTLHGHSSTEAVFWNTYGEGSGNAVESAQWGWGYIIGTSGSRDGVSRGTADNSAPEDFLEGQGSGATLEPQSLYEDQFARRMQGVLANAGTDIDLYTPDPAVPLNGSVYTYGDNAPAFAWSKVSGPYAEFADTNALDTTVSCTNVGTYVFRLTAWDGAATNQDEVTVTVLDIEVGALASRDSIVGESDVPALDYYPDVAANCVGVSGGTGDKTDRNIVFGYSLPTLQSGVMVTGAVFVFEITHSRDTSGADPSLHAYVLNTADPDSSGTNYFYHGPSNSTTGARYVGETYLNVGSTEATYADDEQDVEYALRGDALSLLQSFYGGDNVPDQAEAFFRLNLDSDPTVSPSTQHNRYRIDTAYDESMLLIYTTDPPPPGSLDWAAEATLNIAGDSAWAAVTVNTNLSDALLVWDTIDRGTGSTNDWPIANRLSLGAQSAGVVTGQVTGLTSDTQYAWRYYGVSAMTGGWSLAETFATALTDDEKPVFTGAWVLSPTSVRLDWQDNALYETGYVLQRSTNELAGYITITEPGKNSTTYTDSPVSHSTTYYYRLAATNGNNNSSTELSLCQTSITMPSLAIGSLVSKDSIVGRRQAAAPAIGYYVDANDGLVGVTGSTVTTTRHDRILVAGFSLPTLPAGSTVSNVVLNFEITAARDHDNGDRALNVYMLDTADPDSSGTNYFYHGPSNTTTDAKFAGSTYIDIAHTSTTNFPDDVHDQSYQIEGAAFSLLESFYGGDHIPDQSEVFFRFNLDDVMSPLDGAGLNRYYIDLAADESSLQIMATTPDPDSDSDGMLDAWEIANFGDTTTSDGTGDRDGDGVIDLHEYIAGTQPTNAAAYLRIDSLAPVSGTSYELVWPGVAGKTYEVLYKTNLADTIWLTNTSGVLGSEPFTVTTNSVTSSRVYFILNVR